MFEISHNIIDIEILSWKEIVILYWLHILDL